ncbi:MAG: cyclase family protein, partial [Pseudomonadales bacterium]
YVDAPFHRYEDGLDLAELPLESLADLDALVVPTSEPIIDADTFEHLDVSGKAVLVRTDWSKRWGTPAYLSGHPYLTGQAAALLLDRGAALVGIDSLNIDDTRGGERPVHSTLLGGSVPIVEHLCNLDGLPASGFRFHAAPVKVRAFGTFPVRAYAVVPDGS